MKILNVSALIFLLEAVTLKDNLVYNVNVCKRNYCRDNLFANDAETILLKRVKCMWFTENTK